jgi:cytochrome P450
MEWQWVLVNSKSDERWRRGRKLLDRGLRPRATVPYHLMLQARARVLLARLLKNPHHWKDHIDLSVESPLSLIALLISLANDSSQGESILAMTYGYEVQEHDDKLLQTAKTMSKFGADQVLPGALLVNHLPFCG